MEKISFLEELENRLNQLEKEINKTSKYADGNFHMENMMHFFDSAMDKTSESKTSEKNLQVSDAELIEKNFRFMDY